MASFNERRLDCQSHSTFFFFKNEEKNGESQSTIYLSEPPSKPDRDWIGPVDKRSNLRQIRFTERDNETETERAYREMREEIYVWNHTFWARHNQNFIEVNSLDV